MDMFLLVMPTFNTGFLVLFIFVLLFFGILFYVNWVKLHNAEVIKEDEEKNSRGGLANFPKPLYIEKVIPLPKDLPNRMTLHFPSGFKLEDPENLRKRLSADLESMIHEIRVHHHWMSLEKNSNESWTEVLAKTENVLKEVLQKEVKFVEKDTQKVALR